MVNARQLMAPALKCLDASDSVVLAARRMRALGVSSVPVAGPRNGFIGMVFERDIVEHCVAAAADPREMCVGALVQGSQPAVNINRVADAGVLNLLLRQPLGMLPVVDQGVLVGIITLARIADHLIDDEDDANPGHPWWPERESDDLPGS